MISKFGRIDILVNNAGVSFRGEVNKNLNYCLDYTELINLKKKEL